jgi:hypothetical protein
LLSGDVSFRKKVEDKCLGIIGKMDKAQPDLCNNNSNSGPDKEVDPVLGLEELNNKNKHVKVTFRTPKTLTHPLTFLIDPSRYLGNECVKCKKRNTTVRFLRSKGYKN